MMISNDELSQYQGSSGKHLFESTCLGCDTGILKRIPVIHNQRRSIGTGNVLSRAFKFTSSISMLTFQD